jgi:glutamine synthetase
VDENIYAMADAGRLRSVPASLEKAIDALERDHEFLLREGVFSSDLIETWIHEKRTKEINYIGLRPHPSEFVLYFDT